MAPASSCPPLASPWRKHENRKRKCENRNIIAIPSCFLHFGPFAGFLGPRGTSWLKKLKKRFKINQRELKLSLLGPWRLFGRPRNSNESEVSKAENQRFATFGLGSRLENALNTVNMHVSRLAETLKHRIPRRKSHNALGKCRPNAWKIMISIQK